MISIGQEIQIDGGGEEEMKREGRKERLRKWINGEGREEAGRNGTIKGTVMVKKRRKVWHKLER